MNYENRTSQRTILPIYCTAAAKVPALGAAPDSCSAKCVTDWKKEVFIYVAEIQRKFYR